MFSTNLRKLVGLGIAVGVALLPVAAPAAAADPALPDLVVSASLDKGAYHPGDKFTVDITVKNVGAAGVSGVTAINQGSPVQDEDWGPLDAFRGGEGIRIEPGETYHGTGTGYLIDDASQDSFTLVIWVQGAAGDENMDDNEVTLTAPYIRTKGGFGGTVFVDRDGDHAPDEGEGVPGVEVSVRNPAPESYHMVVTDSRGRFLFEDIPTGGYSVGYHAPTKYTVPAGTLDHIDVDESDDHLDTVIELAPSFSALVHATATFVPGDYEAGDQVHLKVKLTNSGTETYHGIRSKCFPVNEPHLFDPSKHSAFAEGDGVTLAAGATKTFDMWDTLSADAVAKGKVRAQCWFGLENVGGERYAYIDVTYSLTDAPAAQGVAAPNGLANTGVSVLMPLLGGAGLAAVGLLLVLIARKVRSH